MHDYIPGRVDASPRLLADIGGTNARFALETGKGTITAMLTLPCADYPPSEDAAHAYLAHFDAQVEHAVIATANPVDGDAIRMTNHHWAFSIASARAELKLETLLVVNDFTALAMALPVLAAGDPVQVGGGVAPAGSAIGPADSGEASHSVTVP